MTAEERAFNYASTQKCTKLQVGEIVKHYNNGYNQAVQDFLERAERFMKDYLLVSDLEKHEYFCMTEENKSNFIENFKNYMQDAEI